MKVYLISRTKANFTKTLVCANYATVLDALSYLDGTDEDIAIHFVNVEDVFTKTDKTDKK